MSDIPLINPDHLSVCKPGQGSECCRYLVVTQGFACAKHTSLRVTVDARVAAGTMTAQGDNCPGLEADE